MAMVQPGMPGQFGQPNQGGNVSKTGMGKLAGIDKVVLINDNTCCEKFKQFLAPEFSICCCPIRYRVANNGKGYEVGDQTLFTIKETKRCCGNEWTVYNTNNEAVNVFTKKGACPCLVLCLGGPGFDVNEVVHGEKGAHVGSAMVPACQWCDNGYDIIDGDSGKRFFVGSVFRCCHKRMEFEPVWNDQKNELEKMNVRVRPCAKKYMPCLFCIEDYYVVDFPQNAKPTEKAELVAGALMNERFRYQA